MLNLHRTWDAGFMFDANASHTPERAHITMKNFFRKRCGPIWRGRMCLSFTDFPFLEYDSMVCDFPSFPKKNGKSPKEENAAPSLRPENFAGHYPPESSLPAVAQTGAPADATGEIFSLRAPASVQRGGELHQC